MKTRLRLVGAGVAISWLNASCGENNNVVAVDPAAAGSPGAGGVPTGSGGAAGEGGLPSAAGAGGGLGGAGGGLGGAGGAAIRTCQQLGEAFREAIVQAAACESAQSTDPCTIRVPREPGCACDMHVGTMSPDAVERLHAIDAEYRERCELPRCEPCDQYPLSTACNATTRRCRDAD